MPEKKVPAAEPGDYDRALGGVDFPASKSTVLERARDHGGLDSEVVSMFERLPDDEYETRETLVAAIRALYVEDGYAASQVPL